MSEQPKSPKLEFATNIPVTLTPKKLLKEGEHPEYGPWFMWAVNVSGKGDHICFVKAKQHDLLAMNQGKTITVVNAEERTEDGHKYNVLRLVGAAVAARPSGETVTPPPGQTPARAAPAAPPPKSDPVGRSIEAQTALKVTGDIVAACVAAKPGLVDGKLHQLVSDVFRACDAHLQHAIHGDPDEGRPPIRKPEEPLPLAPEDENQDNIPF